MNIVLPCELGVLNRATRDGKETVDPNMKIFHLHTLMLF